MSTISLWRIGTDAGPFRADDLSGVGAEKYGGRFNSACKGVFVVYASAHASLPLLETLVHMGTKAKPGSANRYLIEMTIPTSVFKARQIMTIEKLIAANCHFWDAVPFSDAAQNIGDRFFHQNKSLLLQIPSVIIPHREVPDVNFLINPQHPDFAAIKTVRREKFVYDPRL
ncbi:MAG: RES domain-containing protein [Pseudomonadota bacterium]